MNDSIHESDVPAAAESPAAPERSRLQRVIDWLSVGLTADDELPLVALLDQYLTEAEVAQVVRKIRTATGPDAPLGDGEVTDAEIVEYIRKVVDQKPSIEDIDRVARKLVEAGVPLEEPDRGPDPD